MLDFYTISVDKSKKDREIIYPSLNASRCYDMMTRGKSFYAVWNKHINLWDTNIYSVQELMDEELYEFSKSYVPDDPNKTVVVKYMKDFDSGIFERFNRLIKCIGDNYNDLDTKLTFKSDVIQIKDYRSKRLTYDILPGSTTCYEKLISTLYSVDEREKLEWAVGSILAGDSPTIQKFIVLYGDAGTGKSTFLNIVEKLFNGYIATFEASALTSSQNQFSMAPFSTNPLLAIQHDGDLSRIDDNTRLNSITGHDDILINEKNKPPYVVKTRAFLFVGSNKMVKITDGKSGLLRRLIDVMPTGRKLPSNEYIKLREGIDFELGAIANHCLGVYKKLGKHYFDSYSPVKMQMGTDHFYDFMEENYDLFDKQDSVTLTQATALYNTYKLMADVPYPYNRQQLRRELGNYFDSYNDRKMVDGVQTRSMYTGFKRDKFKEFIPTEKNIQTLTLDKTESIFDKESCDCPAQYASSKETPTQKWDKVTTSLKDLDTTKTHFVKLPLNHIVIDFDLKGEDGNKSQKKNLEAASKWPATYTEFSKSGSGIHLHYIYDGDPETLSRIYAEGIEIKVFVGNSSLRRRLSMCNDIPVATIRDGLPVKGVKMINYEGIRTEKSLIAAIEKNLRKEVHPGTKPSIDFIHHILEEAYASGIPYDVTSMQQSILIFATNSTNQADYCIKLVDKMKFQSEEGHISKTQSENDEIVFYDVEVFPNLFVVVYKALGEGRPIVKLINPSSKDIEGLLKFRLVGFNCRRYDNHILYGRLMGHTLEELYNLSQKIVNGSKTSMFREAYNLSYTDIYDFSSKKQSLKKFEIELGIHHQELGLPWDQPVPEELWDKVADYCINDVVATEATFNARKDDWTARLILAKMSGLTPNDTNNSHTAKIIFGDEKKPHSEFVYTDLREMFPGYVFDHGKSTYKLETIGEGGKVYAEPGMYYNVPLLDVESMHPWSAILMNIFGKYTERFKDIVLTRTHIKNGEIDEVKSMMDGMFVELLDAGFNMDALGGALKIPINSVYGMTSASFDNIFKDPRNIDNIVAKRGALFMTDLKEACQLRGLKVAHIKTDSIKLPGATEEDIKFVVEFGAKYGYKFVHEATYEKMCLVNDAVYIAKVGWAEKAKKIGKWSATGSQFAHPYVFKKLFSKEEIVFDDLCETKSVSTALYLNMNHDLPEGENNYHFVGKVGRFCPMLPGPTTGTLMREKEGSYYYAAGTKGYRWMEAEMVKELGMEDQIDMSYFNNLVDAAYENLGKYGDVERFLSDSEVTPPPYQELAPWVLPCGDKSLKSCVDCPHFSEAPPDGDEQYRQTCAKGFNIDSVII